MHFSIFSLLSLNYFTEQNATETHPCFCWRWIPGSCRQGFLSDPVPPLVFWELKQFGPPKSTGFLLQGAMGFLPSALEGYGVYHFSPSSLWVLLFHGKGTKWTSAPPSDPSLLEALSFCQSPLSVLLRRALISRTAHGQVWISLMD